MHKAGCISFFLGSRRDIVVTLQWVLLKQNTLLMLSYTPRVLAPIVDQMLLPSEQMGVTSHIGNSRCRNWRMPYYTTGATMLYQRLPFCRWLLGTRQVASVSAGRIIYLVYCLYCLAVSYGSTFEFKPSFRSCHVRALPPAMD